MRALSASAMLGAWEGGRTATPNRRAVVLLEAAVPEDDRPEVEHWPIGSRDRALLQLRELMFGRDLPCQAECPSCGEGLEFELLLPDILIGGERAPLRDPLQVELNGFRVRFRLAGTRDLEGAAQAPDPEGALLESCVLEATAKDQPVSASELPREVRDAVAERMAEADPQADLRLGLRCAACEHEWTALFDPGDYLWREVAFRAERLLREVHSLALYYGWEEQTILAMPVARRRAYLELLGVV